MKNQKNVLWMMSAILVCGLTAGALMACGDDKDEDLAQDKMEALCHVLVSEDVLKVADITVHYLDAKGQEATEQMTTTEWKKQWTTTTLPARIGVWAQLAPKAGLAKENYQLKVVSSAGYLFHAAKGGEWVNGWTSVADPYADPEKVAAADVPGWCSKNTAVGCEVDAKGMGQSFKVNFGGNDGDQEPVYNEFCIWFLSIFGLGEDYCE